MPLPKPKKGESEKKFMSRCMGDSVMTSEFPDGDQRAAVCHTQFAGPANNSDYGLRFNQDEGMQVNSQQIRHLMSNLIRREDLDGVDYLVCPTVLICEGVHNGVFYPAEELSKFPDSWAGEPVVVNHPDLMGKPITANSPDVVERQTVGQLFNCYFNEETGKLHGEVWINIEKCKEVAPEILSMLEQNQHIEVSTGLFTECDMEPGEWNGEKFSGTVFNYRPDHLALLPNDKGACSWEDGAGTPRVNRKEDGQEGEQEMSGINKLFSALGEKLGLKVNEISHDDVRLALRDTLATSLNLGQDMFLFVRDVFDKHVIYGVEDKDGKAQLFKQGYSLDANDELQLVGDRAEVKPMISYVPVTNQATGDANQGGTATKGGSAMDRSQMVDALIANSDWGEEDRELLMNMSDDQFDRVNKPTTNEGDGEGEGEAGAAEGGEGEAAGEGSEGDGDGEGDAGAGDGEGEGEAGAGDAEPAQNKESVQDVIANLEKQNPEAAATLKRAVARDEQVKANMIKELKANEACPFSDEELKGKSIEDLEKLLTLSGSEKKVLDFSARVPAEVTANASDGVPQMPVLCPAQKAS